MEGNGEEETRRSEGEGEVKDREGRESEASGELDLHRLRVTI